MFSFTGCAPHTWHTRGMHPCYRKLEVPRCRAAMSTEMPHLAKNYVIVFVRAVTEWLTLILANPNLVVVTANMGGGRIFSTKGALEDFPKFF